MRKTFLIIGLGRFGMAVIKTLGELNADVIAIDVDEKAVLTKEQEEQVTQQEHELIKRYSNKKKSFAVDDLNTGRYRKDLIRTLKRYGAHVIGVNVKTPIETCIERRKGQIPADVIRKIADNMQFITKDEVDEVVNVEK